MGVWHSEDWSRISMKKRQWQRESAAHKNEEVKKLLAGSSFLLDRCPLNGCNRKKYKTSLDLVEPFMTWEVRSVVDLLEPRTLYSDHYIFPS
jgi:hypothetical protein